MSSRFLRMTSARTVQGMAFVALGTCLLLCKAGGLPGLIYEQVGAETWREFLLTLPALGIAIIRESIHLIFSQHASFTVLYQLLLSCWPLALAAAGTALLLTPEREKATGCGPNDESARLTEKGVPS